MTTVLFFLTLTAFLAALGRSATPAAERLPLRTWTWRDLLGNVLHGARRLSDLGQAQIRLWAYLEERPHHRTHRPNRTDSHRADESTPEDDDLRPE